MSSSEGEQFDLDVSGSDSGSGYSEPKMKKASSKAKTTQKPVKDKAPATKAKQKTALKRKVLVDHDENAEASPMEDVGEADAFDNDQFGASSNNLQAVAPAKKKKTASETYTKLTQLEHILKRPDSYVGSIEFTTQTMWTYDTETKRMAFRDVRYVPGFFKIFDEILVNAADHKINDPSMDALKVTIDLEQSIISVYNNGRGIPIEIHSREKIYIPELIFGHLLASSNYDDEEKRLTGGRNGYGAKLANIYSHEFTVETADRNTHQKYKQTWTNNMGTCGKAKITKNSKDEEWTRITFRPDLKRFGMDKIDEDIAGLLRKRVYDMAGTVKDIKVFLNDERLKIKNFKQYVEMYVNSVKAEATETSGGAAQLKPVIIHEQLGARWEVAFAVSDGAFQQVSFANSVSTIKGGTHVTYIVDQLTKHLITAVSKKNKAATLKPAQIKNHIWIFINALIENPTFGGQTKETLDISSSKFGTKPTLSDEFVKKVLKSAIVDNILNWAKYKADREIKKTDGSKRERILGITKLADANNAGTKHAKDCTLILTEGDSAKALAIAGLGVVGRDNFGVFPLRGKLLNVREAKHDQIMKNEEIQNIKKIMGLQHNKDYSNVTTLRYGRLMIMTDQDHDGSHIKGLLINFLDHFYPSLLKLPEFLVEFVTPIVRVTKGKQRHDFFTLPEFIQWQEDTPDARKWTSKYYKGLGSSEDADGRDYFSHMEKHMIPFASTQEGDRELIDLAFSKKRADERKEWLRQFKPGTFLDHRLEEISYSDFINKELILFSMADNIRSIPSIADGLKPGQRKVIWSCFRRKMTSPVKLSQLIGYVMEHAAYHHGEDSLAATIINLAQTYVGSNNVNLLRPAGQYGTRATGGKDHAAPRYITTMPMPMARVLFNPADDNLLNVQKDDDALIEPEWYMPVVPLVLVNGAEGIGTGWSTTIPSYNPVDLVNNIRKMMNNEEPQPMIPWWRGFKGEIKPAAKHKYEVFGIVKKLNDTTVEITELPIHKWTQNYKDELEAMITGDKNKEKEGVLKDYKEHHDNVNVHFVVTMDARELEKAEKQGLHEFFRLTSKINTSNMICFGFDGKIKKYDSPEEILEDFYPMRLAYYQKRKDYLANELQTAFEKLMNQARFVQMIVNKDLVVSNRKKNDIVVDLRTHKFRPFSKTSAKPSGETEPVEEEDEEEGSQTDFDYLLGMPIWSLTKEKIQRLNAQADEKEADLLALLEKSPKDLWNTDLDLFLQEWERDCQAFEEKKTTDANGKSVKRKQTVLKTRKSIGTGRASGSDDDFKPIKGATSKRKPTEKKEKSKDTGVKARAAESSVPKRKTTQKKIVDDDDGEGEDMYMEASPPKTKTHTRKKALAPASDRDSDEDMYVEAPPPAKNKPNAGKKALAPASSSDSDVEVIEKVQPKRRAAAATKPVAIKSADSEEETSSKAKGKAKAPPKRKSMESSEEETDEITSQPTKKTKGVGGSAVVNAKQAESKMDFSDEESGAVAAKPTKKRTGVERPAVGKKLSKSMKPASPPKAKKHAFKYDDESDGIMDYDDLPKGPPRSRVARGAAQKYIDVLSSDEDEDADEGSMFVDE